MGYSKRPLQEVLFIVISFSISSVEKKGFPRATPIGSLISGKPGTAIYFEESTSSLLHHIEVNNNICVLAVNTSKWFWLKSLVKGHFTDPPALRLSGTAGQLREATKAEIMLWHKRVKSVKFTKGHKLMWQRMGRVREIVFNDIHPVHIGVMTSKLNTRGV